MQQYNEKIKDSNTILTDSITNLAFVPIRKNYLKNLKTPQIIFEFSKFLLFLVPHAQKSFSQPKIWTIYATQVVELGKTFGFGVFFHGETAEPRK